MPARGRGSNFEGDDVFDYEELTSELQGKSLTALFSRRCSIVARMRYGDTDEMSQVDTGQQFGDAELHRYNLRTADEIRYNPTMGGAIDPEFGRWQGNRYVRHLHGSQCVRRIIDFQNRCVTSEAVPLHFGGEYGGREGGRPWHGGDEWLPAIFPRMRMAQRTWLHYHNLPGLVRHDFSSHLPIKIPTVNTTATSMNTSWWRPGPTPPPKLIIPGETESLDLSPEWRDDTRALFTVGHNGTRLNNQAYSQFKPKEDGGLIGVVCESPEPGVRPAFGGVSRVFSNSNDLRRPTEFSALNRMNNGNWERHNYLPPENRNAGHAFSSRARANGRAEATLEARAYWVFADTAQQVEQAIHAAANLMSSPEWWPASWA